MQRWRGRLECGENLSSDVNTDRPYMACRCGGVELESVAGVGGYHGV